MNKENEQGLYVFNEVRIIKMMKKIMLFAAAMLMFYSCQNEEAIMKVNEPVFTATIADQTTKTTVNTDASSADNGKVSWENDDEITITASGKAAVYGISKIESGVATFTKKSGETLPAAGVTYTATYGMDLSQSQTYSSSVTDLPMTATSTTTDLRFTVTCGLLKFNLTADGSEVDKTISKVEVNGRLTEASKDTVFTLKCNNESIENQKNFFIALPAGSYTRMTFTSATGKVCITDTAIIVASNMIQSVTISGIKFIDLSELVVNSVQELNDAISAGKTNITLAYNTTPYELGTLALTTPLRLKGQVCGDAYPTVKGSITLSGEIGGSVIFTNINFEGTGTTESIIKEVDDVTADTVAVIGGVIRNYTKALYDNSGKKASSVQYLIFDNIQVYDCSDGSDFIDMRAGAYRNLQVTRSTFARGIRTFIRTDAENEINDVLVSNNTFYKVCTNSVSKDNNGLFHIRGTAGSGIQQYKIQNNLFYSILITQAPGNANGYPKFVSKNAAAIKPTTIMNNYFYNIQEDGGYSWWTVNCSKEEGIAGGGCVLKADPCKDVTKDDFTLTNGVVMNAGVGDPRWNPAKGSEPGDAYAVSSVEEMLQAIADGKTNLSLKYGTYDFTTATSELITAGVLTVSSSLTLTGKEEDGKYPELIGGFKLTSAATTDGFSLSNLCLNGNKTLGNMIDINSAATKLGNITLKNCEVTGYQNRLFSQSVEATVYALVLSGLLVKDMGTSGDFIDFRKGEVAMVSVTNSTFYNGIRTFLRVDASVICHAITVKNNTFYNLCAVDSKDNNGIMHVRSTMLSADSSACRVEKNIFASMHRAATAPNQANGFPKLVSTSSQNIFEPTFIGNIYFDIETQAPYSWWNTLYNGEATGTADGGQVLSETPFSADPTTGNFTVKAAYKGYGDPRW